MTMSVGAKALSGFTKAVAAVPAGSPADAKVFTPKPKPASESKAASAFQDRNSLEKLRGEFREKLMKQRNLTDKVMGSLTAKSRADVEHSLKTAVDQHMNNWLQSAAANPAKDGAGQDQPTKGAVVDIKV